MGERGAVSVALSATARPGARTRRAIASRTSPCHALRGCTPATRPVPARRSRRPSDGSHKRRGEEPRRSLIAASVLQVPNRRIARSRPLAHAHRCLSRVGQRLRWLRRRPVQPVRWHRADLHGRRLPVQDLRGGRRLPGSLSDVRRMVLLPDQRRSSRMPFPLLGMQLPARLREPQLSLLREHWHEVHPGPPFGRP